jgi:hypothetical protein
MIKATVELDQQTFDVIESLAKEQGKSSAELMRDALCNFANRRGRRLLHGAGQYESERKDSGRCADELMRQIILKEHERDRDR